MNTRFERYLENLTPSKRNLAREAVYEYMKGDAEEEREIRNASQVFNLCRYLSLEDKEHSVIILTKARGQLIKSVELCTGSQDAVIFPVRDIIRETILNKARGVIMVHNHPSGSVKPSTSDDEITEKVKKACKIMDIDLVDHVIIGNGNYYSYAENGKI